MAVFECIGVEIDTANMPAGTVNNCADGQAVRVTCTVVGAAAAEVDALAEVRKEAALLDAIFEKMALVYLV